MGKLVEKTMRGSDGKLVEDQSGMFPVVEPEDDYGGNGYVHQREQSTSSY